MSDTTEDQPVDLAGAIRQHLVIITEHWRHTDDPMQHGMGGTSGRVLPASTVVLRADVTLTLAFWVHALVDEWPSVMQTLAADDDGKLRIVTTSLDCTDVYAMAAMLDRERHRIAEWDTFGQTCADDLEPLAAQVRLVSKPPKRDRIAVGECPCGRTVTAKAVRWVRLPVPTSDPRVLAPWTQFQPSQDQLITCKGCGRRETLLGWREAIVGVQRMLTADQLVEVIHTELGMRYDPKTVKVWAHRGLIQSRGQSHDGRTLYDRVQVFAALMERETRRGA